MNKDKLRAICQKLSKETGLSFNAIQTHYFLESILEQVVRRMKTLFLKAAFYSQM